MLPKKIYLNYVNEEDDDITWSEEPVGVGDCGMLNREYTDLSQIWHSSDEIPKPKRRLVIHCDEENEWNPIDQLVYYADPKYPWDELVRLYSILHWAYAKDLVPSFIEDLFQENC